MTVWGWVLFGCVIAWGADFIWIACIGWNDDGADDE